MKVSRWIVGVFMVAGLVVVAPNATAASGLATGSPQTCSDQPTSGCPTPPDH